MCFVCFKKFSIYLQQDGFQQTFQINLLKWTLFLNELAFFYVRKTVPQRYISTFEMTRHLTGDRASSDDYFELCWSNHLHHKIPSASSTAPAGDVAFYCGRRSQFSKDPQLRHAATLERSSCERSSCSRQLVAVEASCDTGCESFSPFLSYIALCPSNSIPCLFV